MFTCNKHRGSNILPDIRADVKPSNELVHDGSMKTLRRADDDIIRGWCDRLLLVNKHASTNTNYNECNKIEYIHTHKFTTLFAAAAPS
mmetsp:Transcript_8438/g.24312  ORF Transcript_8438/g.24312 Transcript_8438/m.24312 type:complete len:88 (-) Transcript_8438:77-340(-)